MSIMQVRQLVKRIHFSGSLDLLDDAEKHNIQKLHSQGFNEEKIRSLEEGESSTKRVRERKLVNYYESESQSEMDSSGSEYQGKLKKDDDDFTLDSSKLEGWFQHNIWSFIIDLAFRINSRINLICGKGMSLTFSDRKNNTSCDTDYGISFNDSRDVDQKKIGKKGDGIFRLKGDRLEFGAIEAKKKWKDRNGRKLIYY
ncbi:hypothetical protein RhiirA4_431557 [Rhizophagus irregularis]|uniref:Uncharacterized protein n=1 Tax=Rhizophagus irregularis TaxID=588596 RepID=A0A2I1HQ99_9GLOM|nr:hypothetical protein RhiirA4_431557 [Rhizophagus irregularis]